MRYSTSRGPTPDTLRIVLPWVITKNGGKIALVGVILAIFLGLATRAEGVAGTWSSQAAMPTARAGLGVAAAANGRLYAIGGTNSQGCFTESCSDGILAVVEEYNPATNTWETKS